MHDRALRAPKSAATFVLGPFASLSAKTVVIGMVSGLLAVGCGSNGDSDKETGGEPTGAETPKPTEGQAPGSGAEGTDRPKPGPDPIPVPEPVAKYKVANVTWGACSAAYTSGARGLQCASLEVPLDWSKPEGEKISVYVSRSLSGATNAPQLWLLQGGPGGSAASMVPFIDMIRGEWPAVDVYTFEHRGVGQSTRLGCPNSGESATGPGGAQIGETEWDACLAELQAKWGEGLAQFNTSNAARDLAAAVNSIREKGRETFVYGVSYGTYWAHRYLQLVDLPPSGVILDSLVPAEGQTFAEAATQYDPVAKRLSDICATQPDCASRFGSDIWRDWSAVVNAQNSANTACSGSGFQAGELKQLGTFLLQQSVITAYLPAILHKFKRCSTTDKQMLRTFRSRLEVIAGGASITPGERVFTTGEDEAGSINQALYYNVVFGELWPRPAPSQAQLVQQFLSAVFATPASISLRDRGASWPSYTQDEFFKRWARTETPVLMMNGTMDVQTPIETAELYKPKFSLAKQTFVRVEHGNHGLINQAPMADGRQCGIDLMVQFMKSRGAVDTSCATKVLPPNFNGAERISVALFGSTSPWDFTAPNPTALVAPDPAAERALADVAQAWKRGVPTLHIGSARRAQMRSAARR
jgi:pimeloyl-ACP methyl ester carboxylesterase